MDYTWHVVAGFMMAAKASVSLGAMLVVVYIFKHVFNRATARGEEALD